MIVSSGSSSSISLKAANSHSHIKMQPTQTNHLSLIFLALLIDHTNALPQTVQARPAVVVNREPSSSNSAMKWVQNNLFYSLLGVGTSYPMQEGLGTDANIPAGTAVLIYFTVRHWRRKKGKKNVKATAAVDCEPSAEEKAANDFKETQNNLFVKMLTFLGSSPKR